MHVDSRVECSVCVVVFAGVGGCQPKQVNSGNASANSRILDTSAGKPGTAE